MKMKIVLKHRETRGSWRLLLLQHLLCSILILSLIKFASGLKMVMETLLLLLQVHFGLSS